MTIDFSTVDMPDEPSSPDEPAVTEPDVTVESNDDRPDRCQVCGNGITYGGRGPRPKYCEDHKRGNAGATPRGTGGTRRGAAWKEPLKNAVMGNIAGIGTLVYAFDQYDGQIIIAGSDRLASSLVDVAETNPKVRKGLEAFTTGGAWAGVAMAAAAIAIPILAHHGMLPGSFASSGAA